MYLLSEHERRVLTGRLALLVAPLLDGTRTIDEIVVALDGNATADEVRGAIATLDAAGHLAHATPIENRVVEVVALGAAAKVAVDLPDLRTGTPGDVVLALTDDYLHAGLSEVNAGTRPWLIAKPVGTVLWVGPFFQPGVTACWECLAARLRENRPIEAYVDSRVGPAPAAAASPASAAAGVALAAFELARRLAEPERTDATVWTLDLQSGASALHPVRRNPHCRVCGTPRGAPSPVELHSVPPRHVLPEVEQYVSPITGVATSLRGTALPAAFADLVHHYVAGYSFGAPTSLAAVRKSLRSSGVGTGATDAQGRVAAICEAIERSAGVLRGDEPSRRASLNELGDGAIDPNDWLLYSDRQLDAHLDPDLPIDWSPVWSLARSEWRYLPTRTLYYAPPSDVGPDWLWADSNGNAAGATLEEAILGGIHELVERDATAIWWSNRIARPAVDFASFGDAYVDAVAARLEQLGRSFWVLDLTTDIDVPVFVAVGAGEEVLMGFGAHVDAGSALRRAVGELMQHVVGVLDPKRAGQRLYDQPQWTNWFETATLERLPYLAPSGESPPHVRQHASNDVRDDIERCRALLEARGLELLVLDLTRPDVGFPVAKAIVPGLRPVHPRFAPGRLYDVPVELGWLDRPLAEDEMNPVARPL